MNATPLRIMIVDDEPAHAEAIRRALENSVTGVAVRVAGTLVEFRAIVAANPPDIALVDLNLPDGRAVEVLNSPPESGLFPILIMTSYGNEQTAVEALKSGALDYVVKSPAAFQEMPRTVARALREWNLLKERKHAADALLESNRRLQLATSSANLGIWDWDIASGHLLIDDRALEQYGLSRDSFSGGMKELEGALHKDDRNRVTSALQESLENKRNFAMGFRLMRPDGGIRHIRSNAIIIRNDEGEVTRMIGLNQDITEQKILEEQLHQSQKMEAIGQLAGGVAHDFNNLLTVIYGYCNLIRMQLDEGSPCISEIDEVLGAARRAANLTGSLLAFSRKQVMNPALVNLNDVVMNVSKLLTRVIGEDIRMETSFNADSLMVVADQGQIEQVLLNIAANARDAMPNGGTFSIETAIRDLDDSCITAHVHTPPGKYAVISLSDSGMGMDEATRRLIFDPFFTTKEVGKGTGLGLSIVYGIIKQHNGCIDVISEPGRGTTFRIRLPLGRALQADTAREETREYPAAGTETVLVAEDDTALRQYTDLLLKKYGYDVILARDGEDAVAKFRDHSEKIDIVVMDMIMPGKSGREAYEEIIGIQPDTKVLFMSGYSPDLLQEKGFFGAVVAKPVQPLDFLVKIRQMLDGSCLAS